MMGLNEKIFPDFLESMVRGRSTNISNDSSLVDQLIILNGWF